MGKPEGTPRSTHCPIDKDLNAFSELAVSAEEPLSAESLAYGPPAARGALAPGSRCSPVRRGVTVSYSGVPRAVLHLGVPSFGPRRLRGWQRIYVLWKFGRRNASKRSG